ncbi:N-acetylglucosamine/diacetylchitobiose ABC transporter substrate-binding protein [Pseudactinotalea suaedae]|jgi:N-acetylglucosamine transport system substrate-binding protein|uniref:N-acetylglucosamine/diacetylchitobiose ABC transporter substrate-binding protein n=1 Tax=Pseudactinotalea suaedae TaxID=1524924 RepID=UPI0012E128D1|nr:N-acetylglucosamine/diacetylchitobiose ABC transporter substrate-binding protein [Pseudactinotalea suaedae]
MSDSRSSYTRRNVLRGALFTAAAVPFGLTLASCATGGGGGDDETTGGDESSAPADADNPFGIEEGSTVETVIFNGGYGVDYVEFATAIFNEMWGGEATVEPTTEITAALQPRFVAGEPPDLIDNSGAQAMGFGAILPQLEDLTDVVDAPNLEGTTIRDTLIAPNVLDSGMYDGKLAAINYVLTVYAVWYSKSLFDANGWTAPTTWAEALELGAAAQEQGKFLFAWGKEAATYYQTLAIDSAIKQGGDEVRLALENLEEGCWSKPAVQSVFTAMKEIVDAGYVKPGGSGTFFTDAQAQWSLDQDALLYPSGSWIENEMKDNTADDFQMMGVPTFVVDDSSALPATALHSEAGEPFIVPSDGANVAGGKEVLRIMLSNEAATNFAKTKLAPTVIKDTVPEDGFGSTALVSQVEMLGAAGSDTFTHKFVGLYGLNQAQLVVWNSFLDGSKTVEALTSDLQAITDEARNTQEVIPVS